MKTFVVLRVSLLLFSLSALVSSCSSSSSSTGPNDQGPYATDPATLSPEPDSIMMEHLMDSASFVVNAPHSKSYNVQTLEDSLNLLVNKSLSMIKSNIPYVWGGRHIDRATKWLSDNDAGGHGYDVKGGDHDNNGDCPPRVGLDCSGFVQLMFEQTGFGRHTPDLTVAQLNNTSNWEFMEKRGYHAKLLGPTTDLKPGDLLFFQNASGELSHIGIYAGPLASGPMFVASAGYPDCDTNYKREAAGHRTGVNISALGGYWSGALNSVMRFSQEDSLSGTIKLHVTMNGSQTQQQGGLTEDRLEQTTIDYTIHLKSQALQRAAAGGWMGGWQTQLTGSCDWTQQTKDTYACNGGSTTDVTNESWQMTGPDLSSQIFAVQYVSDNTGKYQITIAPGINPTSKITHYIYDKTTNCGTPTHDHNENDQGIVPFVQYLTPFTCGAMGSFEGNFNTDHLQSSWNCTDQYPIFNTGSTPVTIPIQVQVSWDLVIQ